jgi:SAM-dependent methyltransferase
MTGPAQLVESSAPSSSEPMKFNEGMNVMKNVKIEDGVVVGTSGDKLTNTNPIARYLLNNFDNKLLELVRQQPADSILEIGCGEGHVTQLLLDHTKATILATDISKSLIESAKVRMRDPRIEFRAVKLEETVIDHQPDLLVCCEVLEHLDDPHAGLQRLAAFRAERNILSVPREPIFRGMNFARGAYVKDFGNSPGHLHHWSKSGFIRLVSQYFDVQETRSPLPWTMVLCKPKS